MISQSYRKSFFISFLGHLAVFGMFTFSFGYKMPEQNYAKVFFLGPILRNSDLTTRLVSPKNVSWVKTEDRLIPTNKISTVSVTHEVYLKPSTALSFNEEKMNPALKIEPPSSVYNKKEPSIMFHPYIPYHFLVYFKDRQKAHIELEFNITSSEGINSIILKRKISSGNLEADLLTMRYISHYLFIQQKRLSLNTWQTVKIDLTAEGRGEK